MACDSAVIKVDNLAKNFVYHTKDLGIKSSIKNLFKREMFTKEAVRKISFEINEGEIVGFLGPNGAGKTTTLKMLSGILHPTDGNAEVMGYVPWRREKNYRMQFSIIMGQKTQLWWDLPANESLFLNKCIYEIDDRDYRNTVDELSDLLGVKELMKIQVRRLSLGERMKMELIAALIHRPRVIFLDEPTIGLDIISQKRIREFFKYYNEKSRTTVILTSHYMKDILDLCKRTIIINQGKIVYDGELSSINNLFGCRKLIKLKFSDYVKRDDLVKYGDIKEYDGFSAALEIERHAVRDITKYIFEALTITDFNIEDISVEEGISMIYKNIGE